MIVLRENILNTCLEKIRRNLEVVTYDDGFIIRGWYRDKYISLMPEGILLVKYIDGWKELEEVLKGLLKD